jgi:hypothetical protein
MMDCSGSFWAGFVQSRIVPSKEEFRGGFSSKSFEGGSSVVGGFPKRRVVALAEIGSADATQAGSSGAGSIHGRIYEEKDSVTAKNLPHFFETCRRRGDEIAIRWAGL